MNTRSTRNDSSLKERNETIAHSTVQFSGVAGPLAAQGGGQICRPFVLGF